MAKIRWLKKNILLVDQDDKSIYFNDIMRLYEFSIQHYSDGLHATLTDPSGRRFYNVSKELFQVLES